MRILFLGTMFPDASAPTRGTYNAALCRELAREHQLRVISPRLFPEALRAAVHRRDFRSPDEFTTRGIRADYPTFWYTPKVLQQHYGEQMWWSIRRRTERALDEFRPEVVLSYWAHPDGEAALRAAQRGGIPSAVIVGGTDVLVLPKHPLRGSRIRDTLLQSHAVITVSDGLRQAVIDLGIPPERVHTIYQGIDTDQFHTMVSRESSRRKLGLADDVPQLVWVGRMVPIKGLDVLLDAVSRLRIDKSVPIRLNLIGDGPLRGQLEREVQRRGLASTIHFAGAVPHATLADWYRAADLTVLSSDSEGLPNVLRESLACGTPFVCTDVGSVREIANGHYSHLVPPRDPVALANAIQRMLDHEYRDQAARYHPRTWTACADETAVLLRQLVERVPDRNAAVSPSMVLSDASAMRR